MNEERIKNQTMSFGVVINRDDCSVCGDCVTACKRNVLAIGNKKIDVVNAKNCNRCGACVIACANRAISI